MQGGGDDYPKGRWLFQIVPAKGAFNILRGDYSRRPLFEERRLMEWWEFFVEMW